MFDPITGQCGPAKLTHKINPHSLAARRVVLLFTEKGKASRAQVWLARQGHVKIKMPLDFQTSK